jgi:hypothetical protein
LPAVVVGCSTRIAERTFSKLLSDRHAQPD